MKKKVRYLHSHLQKSAFKGVACRRMNWKINQITNKRYNKMTKADIVNEISKSTGVEKAAVLETVEKFMEVVKDSLANGENVYLRGFGSFIVKVRSEKTARNISKNTTIIIPEHKIPAFKPAKVFMEEVK